MNYRYVVNFQADAKESGNYDDFYDRLRGNFSERSDPEAAIVKTGTAGNFFFHYPTIEMPEEDRINIARIGGTVVGGPFTNGFNP